MTSVSVTSQSSPAPTLYGREAELATLRACLRAALGGEGQFVLIAGEAGIGKTTLVQCALEDAQGSATILRGSSYDLGVTPPYGPWIEILRSYEPAGDLPRVPVFASNPDILDSLVAGEALFEDAAGFFSAIAQHGPLVLVLEDVQWADHASVELLRFLVRSLLALPVLVVATYRDDELTLGDPLYLLLPHLVRESDSTRIMLRRLVEDDVRQLVNDRFHLTETDTRALTSWLNQLGEGNPFFISELLQTLEYDGVIHEEAGAWRLGNLSEVQVPSLIMQLVDSRLNRLDPGSRQLLQIAAAIGIEAPLELWRAIAGVSDDALADCMEQALAARLIEEIRGRSAFGFRHALIREALYYSIVLPRRRLLHQRIGEELASQPAPDPDILSHHFQQGRDARAVEWLTRAGVRAARQFAWRTAVDRFRSALEILDRDGQRPDDRAWLLYFIGMLSRRSSLPDSIWALEQVITLAVQADDRLLSGIATMDLGMMHCAHGQIAHGLRLMEEGMATLEACTGPGAEAPNAVQEDAALLPILQPFLSDPGSRYGIYVNWLAATGQFQRAIALGEQLVERIPSAPPQIRYDDYYDAFIGLGQAYAAVGRPDDARVAFDRAAAGYSSIEAMPWIYFRSEAFCLSAYWLDQPERREHLWTMIGDAWRRSDGALPPHTRREYRLELLNYLRGDWDEAVAAGTAFLLHGPVGVGRISTRLVLSYIHLHRGDLDPAAEHVRLMRAEFNLDEFGNAWFHAAVALLSLEAQLAVRAGDIERATALIERQAGWIRLSGATSGQAELAMLRATCSESQGDAPAAHTQASAALTLASAPRQPLALMRAARLLAQLETGLGRYAEAAAHVTQALELAVACNTPFELALTRITHAELLVSTGDTGAASQALLAARETCERLGAQPALERIAAIEEQLAQRGRVARAPGGLSDRELEVLALVAQGLSDADVAGRLFISRRTVSGHLQSIYNKLGVSSRTAAVAFAYEHRLV